MRLALAPTLIATHSGLRGRPGVDLTPEVVDAVAGGLVALLEADALPLTVAVARDDRRGGLELARQVVDSLTRRGADVVELGAVSTPTAKLAARRGRLGAAIVVTGSHLEPDWNGLKLSLAPDFLPLDVRELPPPAEEAAQLGEVVQDSDAARIHVEAILATVDVERIRRAALAVAVTGGAGAAASELLVALGCPQGAVPDVTLQLDPDGDRLVFSGADPEATLPIVALAREARIVVKGADSGSAVDTLVEQVHVVPTGELYLARGVLDSGADLAGEGNGGAMIPAVGLARDGLAAGAAVLDLVARTGRPLPELLAAIPLKPIERSVLPVLDPSAALAALGNGAVDDHVGVRIERGEAWALVRASGTEHALRITVEAPTAAEARALHDELLRIVSS